MGTIIYINTGTMGIGTEKALIASSRSNEGYNNDEINKVLCYKALTSFNAAFVL